MSELATRLAEVLPKALAWAMDMSAMSLREGMALNPQGCRVARLVGVANPERVRLLVVSEIPVPDDPELRQLALDEELIGPDTHGLTFGYGIIVLRRFFDARLLAHECRHVHQVEQAGSLAEFLPVYLKQIANYGYRRAPLEIDAKNHESVELPP